MKNIKNGAPSAEQIKELAAYQAKAARLIKKIITGTLRRAFGREDFEIVVENMQIDQRGLYSPKKNGNLQIDPEKLRPHAIIFTVRK